jgi:ADP-heptose:LPS heptosyltransferase
MATIIMKILVLRFSSIGDLVLISPVLRCLKLQLGAEVHVLTKKRFASVLAANPHIDGLHTFEQEPGEVWPQLKTEHFDHIIDLHKNLRSWRVRLALRLPGRSFRKLNLEKWLLVNTGINCLPDIHIVERYMEAAAPLGVRYDGAGLEHFIAPEDEVDIATAFGVKEYLAVAIGAAHATKRMPESLIAEVCGDFSWPILLLGGPEDGEAGERIASKAGVHVQNTCGKLRLQQSASLVRQARVVLSPDTGMMHLAAAFRRPLVSVWGSTVPAFGMWPLYPAEDKTLHILLEVTNLSCRPCSKIGFEQCPKGHFKCMNGISAQTVKSALKRLWEQAPDVD